MPSATRSGSISGTRRRPSHGLGQARALNPRRAVPSLASPVQSRAPWQSGTRVKRSPATGSDDTAGAPDARGADGGVLRTSPDPDDAVHLERTGPRRAGLLRDASADCSDPAAARGPPEVSLYGQSRIRIRSEQGLKQGVECPSYSGGYRITWHPPRQPIARPLVNVSCSLLPPHSKRFPALDGSKTCYSSWHSFSCWYLKPLRKPVRRPASSAAR